MRIDVISALPSIVLGPLDHSIIHRAREKGLLQIEVHDLRDYSEDKHKQIDDYPFGGGGGMVLKPEPIFRCVDDLSSDVDDIDELIFLTPDGDTLDQSMANELSLKKRLVLLAGHYKGVDQRVRDSLVTREISIGDFVLSGGELPALVLIDAIARLIPGVLGNATSALSDSFQDGLLDAPAYTRPKEFKGMIVPEVLTSGHKQKIDEWREEERFKKTRSRRPDLLDDE